MSTDLTLNDVTLSAFRPRRALRVPATTIERPAFPVVSSHEHLRPVFGGDWAQRPVPELLEALQLLCGTGAVRLSYAAPVESAPATRVAAV